MVSLKRAALHLRKFSNSIEICTINKTLDGLLPQDLTTNENSIKVHFFSNILDIDFFNLTNLLNLLKHKYKRDNLFIITSPCISDQKTQRINDFVESFQLLSNFNLLLSITEKKGQWEGTNWSRVIRVFSVKL